MTVSFLLAVYNGAATLRGCLDHLFSQTFTDWECLAVNDGSVDESAAILADYARRDRRLKILNHDRNRGVSTARNTGLGVARGEFALLLDQDDHVLPEGVARLVRHAGRFPHAAAFAGSCILSSPQRRVLLDFTGPDYDITFADLCKNNRVMAPAVLMRQALVHEVGGLQVGLEGSDDWDLWGRLTRTGRPIRRCNITVSEYRVHESNQSRKALRQFRTGALVLERMYTSDPRLSNCAPQWRDGAKPEDKPFALLMLMWANAAMPLLTGDLEEAVAIVEHTLTLLPTREIRPETAAMLHDCVLFPCVFAGVDPKNYYPQTRLFLQKFFVRMESLLQHAGFAEAASAALADRCIATLARENERLTEEVECYRNSRSFRLGRLLTEPLHWLRRLRNRE